MDAILRGGTIYDGSGGEPYVADIAVKGEQVVRIGDLHDIAATVEIDVTGLAVAPGFINMLSHSHMTILQDPRSLSELKQGVTTQVFGEGTSMGPVTESRRRELEAAGEQYGFDAGWTRLSEYLRYVERRGTSQNVASFIGAATIRTHELGHENRAATEDELVRMQALVTEEMQDGALGIGSALVYAPGAYASTDELIALCRAAAPYGGTYISHIRSEGPGLVEAIGELTQIARESELGAEIYHLKAAGRSNWPKIEQAIEAVEQARADGLRITADMYTYTASSTGLAARIPARLHEGGFGTLLKRLEDPDVRSHIVDLLERSGWSDCEGGADGVTVLRMSRPANREFQGKTLTQAAETLGMGPSEAVVELVRLDRSRVQAAFALMSEDNIRRQLGLPWVSFGSDGSSRPAEGAFLESLTHPRSFGNFARLLGRYVREEQVITLPEAVRRLARLPADTLGLDRRGQLCEGYFADVVVFDPQTVADLATFESPHRYATGVHHVLVNGTLTLRDGEWTGALAGCALRGPGRRR